MRLPAGRPGPPRGHLRPLVAVPDPAFKYDPPRWARRRFGGLMRGERRHIRYWADFYATKAARVPTEPSSFARWWPRRCAPRPWSTSAPAPAGTRCGSRTRGSTCWAATTRPRGGLRGGPGPGDRLVGPVPPAEPLRLPAAAHRRRAARARAAHRRGLRPVPGARARGRGPAQPVAVRPQRPARHPRPAVPGVPHRGHRARVRRALPSVRAAGDGGRELAGYGFTVTHSENRHGLAVHHHEDPRVCRIVARLEA